MRAVLEKLAFAAGGLLVAVMLIVAFMPAPVAATAVAAGARYEYTTLTFTTDTAKLNALGRDGWEMVLYQVDLAGGFMQGKGTLLFKRVTP